MWGICHPELWISLRGLLSGGPLGVRLGAEPPTGEHCIGQGQRALRLDRAPAGGEEGPTTGGMTLPSSTDPLGRRLFPFSGSGAGPMTTGRQGGMVDFSWEMTGPRPITTWRSWMRAGKVLARRRLPEGVARGRPAARAESPSTVDDPAQVAVGIETDRGLWVDLARGGGLPGVCASIRCLSARYRERHSTSGAKSDAGGRSGFGRLGAHRPSPPSPDRRRQP